MGASTGRTAVFAALQHVIVVDGGKFDRQVEGRRLPLMIVAVRWLDRCVRWREKCVFSPKSASDLHVTLLKRALSLVRAFFRRFSADCYTCVPLVTV